MPPVTPKPLPAGLGARIDRAVTIDDLSSLMAEAARLDDTPESHRKMDDCLIRIVQVLAAGHPRAKTIRDILWKYERADRWFDAGRPGATP